MATVPGTVPDGVAIVDVIGAVMRSVPVYGNSVVTNSSIVETSTVPKAVPDGLATVVVTTVSAGPFPTCEAVMVV